MSTITSLSGFPMDPPPKSVLALRGGKGRPAKIDPELTSV
jgi:hypothetical protein